MKKSIIILITLLSILAGKAQIKSASEWCLRDADGNIIPSTCERLNCPNQEVCDLTESINNLLDKRIGVTSGPKNDSLLMLMKNFFENTRTKITAERKIIVTFKNRRNSVYNKQLTKNTEGVYISNNPSVEPNKIIWKNYQSKMTYKDKIKTANIIFDHISLKLIE